MILCLLDVGNSFFFQVLSGKGQGKFLATTRIACLPKTHRYLTLSFLSWMDGRAYGGIFFFIFYSFCMIFKPR